MTPALKGDLWWAIVAAFVLSMTHRLAYIEGQISVRRECIDIITEANKRLEDIVKDTPGFRP